MPWYYRAYPIYLHLGMDLSDDGTIAKLVCLVLEWLIVELSVCQVCVYMLPACIGRLPAYCMFCAGGGCRRLCHQPGLCCIYTCVGGGYDWPALV